MAEFKNDNIYRNRSRSRSRNSPNECVAGCGGTDELIKLDCGHHICRNCLPQLRRYRSPGEGTAPELPNCPVCRVPIGEHIFKRHGLQIHPPQNTPLYSMRPQVPVDRDPVPSSQPQQQPPRGLVTGLISYINPLNWVRTRDDMRSIGHMYTTGDINHSIGPTGPTGGKRKTNKRKRKTKRKVNKRKKTKKHR